MLQLFRTSVFLLLIPSLRSEPEEASSACANNPEQCESLATGSNVLLQSKHDLKSTKPLDEEEYHDGETLLESSEGSSNNPPDVTIDGYEWIGHGYCRGGFLGKALAGRFDIQDCADLCEDTPECASFSYYPGKQCSQYLITADCIREKIGWITYTKATAAPTSEPTIPPTPFPPPSTDWTDEEALIIMAKVRSLVANAGMWRGEWQDQFECYAEHPNNTWDDYKFVPCSYYCDEPLNPEGCAWGRDADGAPAPYYCPRGIEPQENMAMLVRFGFHTCQPNKDGTGGCNGCLNMEKAFLRLMPWNPVGKKVTVDSRPPSPAGHNANLVLLGDLFERIFTDADWPPYAPKLDRSPKDSGKSRADLWAFAASVGVYHGFQRANNACDEGTNIYSDDLMPSGFPCKVTLDKPLRLSTGRQDCESPTLWKCWKSCYKQGPDWSNTCSKMRMKCGGCPECPRVEKVTNDGTEMTYRPRAFENTRDEDSPDDWFNGSMTADYFSRTFGMSPRESIVLMGSHSLGSFHGEVSGGFRYSWTHKETQYLNNIYYRILAAMPGKHYEAEKSDKVLMPKPIMVGREQNKLTRTGYKLHSGKERKGGGHYQWFHQYERCVTCQDGVNIDRHATLWKDKETGENLGNKCCDLCAKATDVSGYAYNDGTGGKYHYDIEGLTWSEKKDFTDLGCLRNLSVHEVMLTVDFSLMWGVDVDPVYGTPSGCTGLFSPEWIQCPRNDVVNNDDGMTMADIVEEYADNQDKWANDFVDAWHKMLANVDAADTLKPSFEFDDITCTEGGVGAKEAQESYPNPKTAKYLWKCEKR